MPPPNVAVPWVTYPFTSAPNFVANPFHGHWSFYPAPPGVSSPLYLFLVMVLWLRSYKSSTMLPTILQSENGMCPN